MGKEQNKSESTLATICTGEGILRQVLLIFPSCPIYMYIYSTQNTESTLNTLVVVALEISMTVKGSDFPKLQNCLSHTVAIALITIITMPTNLFTTMNTALAVLNFFLYM